MATDIKDQIKRGIDELYKKNNPDIINEIFSEDYIAHAGGKDYRGHKFLKAFFNQLSSAIHNIKVVKLEFYTQTKDTIVWQRTISGKHMENMKGIPPSEQRIRWHEMVVSRFEGSKISEEWVVSELMGQLLLKCPKKQ